MNANTQGYVKSAKARAIEKTVAVFKKNGYAVNQITAELVFRGVFDEQGTEIISGIESQGFAKGNMNDFYRYLNYAKKIFFEENGETNPVIATVSVTNKNNTNVDQTSEIKMKLDQAFNDKLNALEIKYQDLLVEKDLKLAGFLRSGEELQSVLQTTRNELTVLKVQYDESTNKIKELSVAYEQLKQKNSDAEERFQKNINLLSNLNETFKIQENKNTQVVSKEFMVVKLKLSQNEIHVNQLEMALKHSQETEDNLRNELQEMTIAHDQLKSDFAYERGRKETLENNYNDLESNDNEIKSFATQDSAQFNELFSKNLIETIEKLTRSEQKNLDDKMNRIIAAIQAIARNQNHFI